MTGRGVSYHSSRLVILPAPAIASGGPGKPKGLKSLDFARDPSRDSEPVEGDLIRSLVTPFLVMRGRGVCPRPLN